MNPNRPTPPASDDPLVQLYREATAADGGPAVATRERVLAYAAAQARQRRARPPAANDARWLRHAVASIAAIGVVGVLVLHHGRLADTDTGPRGHRPAAESALPASPAPQAPASASTPAADQRPRAASKAAPARQAETQDCAAPADARQAKRANAHGTRPHKDQDCAAPAAKPKAPAGDPKHHSVDQ